MSKELLLGWGFVIIATLFDCFTLFVVKWRATVVGKFEFGSLLQIKEYLITYANHPLIWMAMASFILGPAFGYIALTRLELTIAYPVSITLHIIITFALGVFLLQEPMHVYKAVGLMLMFGGLYFFFKSH